MSKYIDADKLIAEIHHLKIDVYDEAHQFDIGARSSLTFFESFIDSLQQEQPSLPDNLDEIAEEWAENEAYGKSDAEFEMAYKGFKAEAEWMAKQMNNDN